MGVLTRIDPDSVVKDPSRSAGKHFICHRILHADNHIALYLDLCFQIEKYPTILPGSYRMTVVHFRERLCPSPHQPYGAAPKTPSPKVSSQTLLSSPVHVVTCCVVNNGPYMHMELLPG